jgi:hypothetical protein
MTMQIPTSTTIANKTYNVTKVDLPGATLGQVYPDMGFIELHSDDSYVYWHELTHAILYEMGSDLWRNERFVTAFSKLLDQSIQTAKFNGKT